MVLDCFTGNNMEALKVALSDPPTGCKDKSLKVTSYKLSLKAELIHGRKPGNKASVHTETFFLCALKHILTWT